MWLILGFFLVSFANPGMTRFEYVELPVIALALHYSPWIYREYYEEGLLRPVFLISALALGLILIAPSLGSGQWYARTFLSGILALLYGLPLIRRWDWRSWVVFLAVVLMVAFDLLPLTILSMEGSLPSEFQYLAVFQTNPQEVLEYLRAHLQVMPVAVLLAGPIILLLLARALPSCSTRKRVRAGFFALLCVNFISAIPPGFLEVAQTYKKERAAWRTLADQRSQGLAQCSFTALPPATPRRILLVINESISRRHLGLYGYEAPTTPNLGRLLNSGGLFVFDQVISPHCLTMQSLEKVLTNSNNENHLPFSQSVSLIDIFRKAGFQVSWVSNQNAMGLWDNQVSVMASAAHRTVFTSRRIGARCDAAPDGNLLPLLDPLLSGAPGKSLVVCHLMGAHADYSRRPDRETFLHWNGGVGGLSAYDLAIQYNDFILGEIQGKAAKAGFDTVVMLSDHGELPHRPWGHDPDRFDPEMVEIPFVVWLAPQFRKARPELVAHLKKRLHTPFMSDGFFHTMTDLAGISCSLMDPTRSLINPAYRERPRCVIDGRIPYIPAPEFHAVTSQGR